LSAKHAGSRSRCVLLRRRPDTAFSRFGAAGRFTVTRPFVPIALLLLCSFAACHRSAKSELDWAIGTWHGTRTAADDGKAVAMIVKVEPLGSGQVERLQVELASRPYVGFTVRERDADGHWTMIYANSTRQSIGRLAGQFQGNRSTWESMKSSGPHGSRFISERVDPNHWRRTQFNSEDSGKTWKLLFTDELERDTSKPPN
jgi:hypothetical protein